MHFTDQPFAAGFSAPPASFHFDASAAAGPPPQPSAPQRRAPSSVKQASRQRSCEGCKARKMRCSRTANCAACSMRGEQCVWLRSAPQAPGPTTDSISSAQAEIARLRKLVELLVDRLEARPDSLQSLPPTGDIPVSKVDRRQVEDAEALLSFANSPTSPKLPTPTSAPDSGSHFSRRFDVAAAERAAVFQPQPYSFAPHPHPHQYAPHFHPYAPQPHHHQHPPFHPLQLPPLHSIPPPTSRPFLPPIQTTRPVLPPQVYYESPPPSAEFRRRSGSGPEVKAGHEARYDEAVRAKGAPAGLSEVTATIAGVGLGIVGDALGNLARVGETKDAAGSEEEKAELPVGAGEETASVEKAEEMEVDELDE